MSGLARNTDPQTSRAAVPCDASLSWLRWKALQQFGQQPDGLIPDEVEDRSGIRGIWRRCSDLKNEGLVEVVEDVNGPVTRKGRSGKDGEVLRITPEGVDVLAELDRNPPKQRRRRLTREDRVLAVVRRYMEAPDDVRFATNQTKAEKHPATFAREIRKAWES
jgi:hypothetical protein